MIGTDLGRLIYNFHFEQNAGMFGNQEHFQMRTLLKIKIQSLQNDQITIFDLLRLHKFDFK